MSFSNPTSTSPAQKFFKWKGGNGSLVWWDKQTETELPVTLPFRFIVLDELTTIKGYSDANLSGIWSNEIRSLKTGVLRVRTKGSDIATGTYADIKDKLKASGGKFARSVYVAYQEADGEDGNWVIGNINFSGASVGDWFEFSKKNNLQVEGAVITGLKEDKKGATTFFVPTFDTWQFQPSDIDTGTELDKKLQTYLDSYFKNGEKPQEETTNDFEEVVIEDFEDKPIDLSEIPF